MAASKADQTDATTAVEKVELKAETMDGQMVAAMVELKGAMTVERSAGH